jgi:hypothetical protein
VAWLGAQATRRRERWSHRREVYQPILLSLMDLYIHSRRRLRLEEESDSADSKSQVRLNGQTPGAGQARPATRWSAHRGVRYRRRHAGAAEATGRPTLFKIVVNVIRISVRRRDETFRTPDASGAVSADPGNPFDTGHLTEVTRHRAAHAVQQVAWEALRKARDNPS